MNSGHRLLEVWQRTVKTRRTESPYCIPRIFVIRDELQRSSSGDLWARDAEPQWWARPPNLRGPVEDLVTLLDMLEFAGRWGPRRRLSGERTWSGPR